MHANRAETWIRRCGVSVVFRIGPACKRSILMNDNSNIHLYNRKFKVLFVISNLNLFYKSFHSPFQVDAGILKLPFWTNVYGLVFQRLFNKNHISGGFMTKALPVRQRVRLGLLIISMLMFPITMNYLSPYVSIDGAVRGILAASPVIFALQFVSALFFGRLFCGWICPAGMLQDVAAGINNNPVNGKKTDWIKWAIWFPWFGTLTFFLLKAGAALRFDPLHLTESGISVDEPWKYITYFMVVLLFMIVAVITGRRGSCHTICWMAPFMIIGRKLGNYLSLPGLRLRAEPEKCTDCRVCTANCPMSLDVNGMVKAGIMENPECILCGKCVDGCSKKAIRFVFEQPK